VASFRVFDDAGERVTRNSEGHRPRVLFVYPIDATFIRTDLALIAKICEVLPLRFAGAASYPALLKTVPAVDLVLSWFALGFSAVANLTAKAFGRKSVVVAGGWDVVGLPEIGYGRLLARSGRAQARLALSAADQVLAFSNWSERLVRGVCPRANVRTAYLGVDVDRLSPAAKEDLVVCVAHVSRENVVRKGLKEFALASRSMPEVRFVLVGRYWDDASDELHHLAGGNLSTTGWIPDGELRAILARAKVYVQASYTEGFGLAVAEAMASGCVPVVTRAGALPEVVGDTGFYVDYGDASSLEDGIRRALASDRGARARRRALELFTLEHRLRDLRKTIEELLGVAVTQRKAPSVIAVEGFDGETHED